MCFRECTCVYKGQKRIFLKNHSLLSSLRQSLSEPRAPIFLAKLETTEPQQSSCIHSPGITGMCTMLNFFVYAGIRILFLMIV